MKRREFFNVFMAAVATVAIGLRVAEGVPKVQAAEWTYEGVPINVEFAYRYAVLNPNAIVRISEA